MKNAIIFGANSTIAREVINELAVQGYNLFLLARDEKNLELLATDIQIRYTGIMVKSYFYDTEVSNIKDILNQIYNEVGLIDLALIAYGNLPNQDKCSRDFADFKAQLVVNGLSVIEICHSLALKMKEQQHGTIAVISSVAGLRGRQSNYAYGTAKGMLNIYLQGLRNELFGYNVHVLTIMPGFVDTKMTRDFKKGLLWVSPQKVAKDIMNAITKKKDIIYTPWFWQYIMFIIRSIPEAMFKKLKL